MIRAREKEIQEILEQPPEERARKRAKCTHGPVPEDSNKYLTQASVDLRNKAERREAKKANRENAVRKIPRKRWELVKWVGKPVRDVDNSGQTLYAPSLALALVADSSCSLPKVEDVLSEGDGMTVHSWPRYIQQVLCKERGSAAAMVVVSRFVSPAWQSEWALCCMIVGGFLTNERWLAEAVAKKARPAGLFYPGIPKKGMKIHICECTQSQLPSLFDLFRVLDQLGAITLTDFGKLREAWNKYQAARGLRSQPWKTMVAVCWDTESKTALLKRLKDTERPMVLTLPDFLDKRCLVRREVVCGGCWVPVSP